MTVISKKITLMAFATLFTSMLSINAHADFVSNDAKNLTHCRYLLETNIGQVERIKTANIKAKSRSFTVNYKIVNNGDRSTFQCKLQKGKDDSVICLKGALCADTDSAVKGQ